MLSTPHVQRKDSIDRVFSHLTPQNKRISGRTSTLGLYRTTIFHSFIKVSRESKLNQSCKLKVLNIPPSSLFFTCTKVSLCYTSSAHPSQSSGTHWRTRKRTCIALPCWTWPRSWLCLWLNIWACKHQTPAVFSGQPARFRPDAWLCDTVVHIPFYQRLWMSALFDFYKKTERQKS